MSSPFRAYAESTTLFPTAESRFKAIAHVNELTRRHPTGTPKHPKIIATMYSYGTGVACNLAGNPMALGQEKMLRVNSLDDILSEDDAKDGAQDGQSITRAESTGEEEARATASEAEMEAL